MATKRPIFDKVSEEDLADAPKGKWLDALRTPLDDQLAASKSLFSGGITFAQNIGSEVKELDVQVPDPWIAPTLVNDWNNTVGRAPAGYMKHPDGTVEIRGVIDTGTNSTFMTLPEGYRPEYEHRYAIDSLAAFAIVNISSAGVCSVALGSLAGPTCIDTRFLAKDATPFPNSSFPVVLSTKFTKKPISVFVVSIADIDGTDPRPLGCVMTLDWDYGIVANKPSIKIKNLGGLPYNRKYRIKLLIVGE